jgi:hypothetical protein
MELVAVPERPASVKAYSPKSMAAEYPESSAVVIDMISEMKAVHQGSKSLTKYWSLNAFSHYDWKGKDQKNMNRDFRKFAVAAFFEERAVGMYRGQLLKESHVAAYLRSRLQSLFCVYAKPQGNKRSGLAHPTTKIYQFPDLLPIPEDLEVPQIDADEAVSSSSKGFYLAAARSNIQSLCRSVENSRFAKSTPAGAKIDQDVQYYLIRLQRVRRLLFLYPHLRMLTCIFLQALMINSYRLEMMTEAGMADDANPDDQEWAVDLSSIRGLPILDNLNHAPKSNVTSILLPVPVDGSLASDHEAAQASPSMPMSGSKFDAPQPKPDTSQQKFVGVANDGMMSSPIPAWSKAISIPPITTMDKSGGDIMTNSEQDGSLASDDEASHSPSMFISDSKFPTPQPEQDTSWKPKFVDTVDTEMSQPWEVPSSSASSSQPKKRNAPDTSPSPGMTFTPVSAFIF